MGSKGQTTPICTVLSCIGVLLSLTLLAGCGGGGGDGGPAQPPSPPWTLTMYESGKPSPVAEGTLTVEADRYLIEFAGEKTRVVAVQREDVARSGELISVPLSASGPDTFRFEHLQRTLRDISDGRPTSLRSADGKHTYMLRPEPSPVGNQAAVDK